MVATINRGIAAYAPLGGAFTPAEGLTDEQKHAIQFILTSRDLAVNLRGAAGTGKTRTLQELNRGLAENGRETLALAPTVGAVEELTKVGFAAATTITRLLEDEELRHAARGKVVILDEAGMVSGRQMAEFLAVAETHSMRIVFSGDTKQLRSVEAGDALRILEHDSRLKSTSLTQVQRQKPEEYREAIEELRRHPGRGFDKLEAMGAIREAHCLKRADEVARAYADGARELNVKGEKRSVLVVAATHDELATVTDAIRAQRKAAGELAGSVSVDRHVPLNFTVAQKKDFGNFSAGQLLIFHRRVNGIRKNEVLEVERVEGQRVIAKTQSAGVERIITARQAKAFDVFDRKTVRLSFRRPDSDDGQPERP